MVARWPPARVETPDHLECGHVVEPLGDSHVVAGILRESAQLSCAQWCKLQRAPRGLGFKNRLLAFQLSAYEPGSRGLESLRARQ
jgi:hypothetical protein